LNGSCSPAGQVATIPSGSNFPYLLYCNGTNWVNSSLMPGNSVTTCNSAALGVVSFNGAKFQWCDGTNWQLFVGSGGVTPGVPGAGGTGYFVMSSTTYNGNLGGISGANAKCRSDLAANNWKNKPGTLDTTKVFAFLCDGVLCNGLIAGTTYYYAVSGNTTYGGASFTTNAGYGDGPLDSTAWNGSTRFGSTLTYWSNYGSVNDSEWFGQPADDNCTNWSYSGSGQYGVTGISNATTDNRWNNTYTTCNTAARLICYVNP